jgi:uncharacterized protein (DUF362 family)/NAD-dependent dihydropyrimidine dehydrogenase PreA subunit
MISSVSLVKCSSYDTAQVHQAVRSAVDLLGGIEKFIRPSCRVLVKPNLLMAKGPESGVDTHPEIVRAVVRILKDINCQIFIGDGPCVWGSQLNIFESVYEKSGIKKVAEEESVELVSFEKRRWRGKFPITTWLDNCDYLVSIPKFKTHNLTILTGAIKNLFGLVPGTYKTELHKQYFDLQDFAGILVDIFEQATPALTVVDGIVAMEGEGPGTSGRLRNPGLIVAGSDAVAVDSILSLIMGLKPKDILTTKEAARRALGVADINSIQTCGERLEDVIDAPFQLPPTSLKRKLISRPVAMGLVKRLIRFYPQVNDKKCTRCGVCIDVCPQKVVGLKNNHIVFKYRGCIACFCCMEACPDSALKIKKSLAAKIIGL